MRQRPCQISGYHRVKLSVLKLQLFRVHHPKIHLHLALCRKPARFLDHGRRQIDAGHMMALFRKQDRKKSASCSHVQNPQALPAWKLRFNLRKPEAGHLALQLLFPEFCEIPASFCPV